MSDGYKYGPWIEVPAFGKLQGERAPLILAGKDGLRFRIATPKPKRELVVGKWYRTTWRKEWFQCIFPEGEDDGGYFRRNKADPDAEWFNAEDIDWSTPPRDEAPE